MSLFDYRQFAFGAVESFAAVEDTIKAASVVFGDDLPQVLDLADKATTSFGLSRRAAIEAAVRKADSANFVLLRHTFPEIADDGWLAP